MLGLLPNRDPRLPSWPNIQGAPLVELSAAFVASDRASAMTGTSAPAW
jgi:hypothetical protein